MQVKFSTQVGTASVKREAQAQILSMLQTWQLDLNLVRVIEKERWGIKMWKKAGEKGQEGLEHANWQISCYVLANWTNESFSNSVAEFECLRLSCQGSSGSGHQAGMFDEGRGEGRVSAKCKVQAQL